MNWLDLTTGIFSCVAQNKSIPKTFREILFSDFGSTHEWFYKKDSWINGTANDLDTIMKIRSGQIDKSIAKQTLQCYTPSAYYSCKKKGAEILVHRNPILQLDFDKLQDYDLGEVKQAIFDLPFVGCVSKSVSGDGLFVLILIDDETRLSEYYAQCSRAFRNELGIIADPTKGSNPVHLRFISYDENFLYREDPQPLKIKHYYKPAPTKKAPSLIHSACGLVNWGVGQIQSAQNGDRNNTVHLVSYTLGGRNAGLSEIIHAINSSPQYSGEESEFLATARNSFSKGQLKPFAI